MEQIYQPFIYFMDGRHLDQEYLLKVVYVLLGENSALIENNAVGNETNAIMECGWHMHTALNWFIIGSDNGLSHAPGYQLNQCRLIISRV